MRKGLLDVPELHGDAPRSVFTWHVTYTKKADYTENMLVTQDFYATAFAAQTWLSINCSA